MLFCELKRLYILVKKSWENLNSRTKYKLFLVWYDCVKKLSIAINLLIPCELPFTTADNGNHKWMPNHFYDACFVIMYSTLFMTQG